MCFSSVFFNLAVLNIFNLIYRVVVYIAYDIYQIKAKNVSLHVQTIIF